MEMLKKYGGYGEMGFVWIYSGVWKWWEKCYGCGGQRELRVHGRKTKRSWATLESPKGCQLPWRRSSSRLPADAFLAGRCFDRVFGNHWAPRFWQGMSRGKEAEWEQKMQPRAWWGSSVLVHFGHAAPTAVTQSARTHRDTHTTSPSSSFQQSCPELVDNATNNGVRYLFFPCNLR